MDFWEVLLNRFDVNLLVFARIMGIFAFNPILSRRNIPAAIKVGASLAITMAVLVTLELPEVEIPSVGVYGMMILREALIGVILGFLTQLVISSILIAGEVMDMQAGLSMAKIYDPSSGVQMPITGSIAMYMFYLLFFATNSHLTYIRIFILSFDMFQVGSGGINAGVGMVIVEYFSTVFILALKLAMPLMASELIMEISVGILMKAVPQIQVMVVNMQLKILFAIGAMVVLCPVTGKFLDGLLGTISEVLTDVAPIIGSV